MLKLVFASVPVGCARNGMSSVFTTDMLDLRDAEQYLLFWFVVGNVENGDLVGRGNPVIYVHVEGLLIRYRHAVFLFVKWELHCNSNVNGGGRLVRLTNHRVVRLHNALHITYERKMDVVTTG